ncbi:MAG: fasciclin domain-containing protein [Pseudomonadota bacterium]
MKTKTLLTLTAAAVFAASTAIAGGMKKDIVDTAASTNQFNTLIAAAQAAELVDVLKGDGPLTVFAPTDAAFAALPEGTVESLLLPENKEQLAAILTYHVVAGNVTSDMLQDDTTAETVNGATIAIDLDSGVMINDATVTTADVAASNGTIHIIDKVLIPGS